MKKETAMTMELPKRERIQLIRQEGDRNRVIDQERLTLWFDTKIVISPTDPVFTRLLHERYTGIVLYPETYSQFAPYLSDRVQKVLNCTASHDFADKDPGDVVVSSADLDVLTKARAVGFSTCYRAYVDDADSLHQSIALGTHHAYLMVSFRDPTNIPLELVIATLQATKTVLIKEITIPTDVDDAIVTLGVMEVGADGVMFSPKDMGSLEAFLTKLNTVKSTSLSIQTGTVIKTAPVGMGYRSCVDLATIFSPQEGMIVGSTSQGGLLLCPEVFFLPYMELRPFRVNAGAVHSYVYNHGDRTEYMTELRAGVPVMVVGAEGKTRRAVVGRIKTEIRPLRLIEVEFAGGERVNVLLQDDWHVRIFSDKGLPLNITELKPGDKVLGHVANPGRHVGIKVDEHILEN